MSPPARPPESRPSLTLPFPLPTPARAARRESLGDLTRACESLRTNHVIFSAGPGRCQLVFDSRILFAAHDFPTRYVLLLSEAEAAADSDLPALLGRHYAAPPPPLSPIFIPHSHDVTERVFRLLGRDAPASALALAARPDLLHLLSSRMGAGVTVLSAVKGRRVLLHDAARYRGAPKLAEVCVGRRPQTGGARAYLALAMRDDPASGEAEARVWSFPSAGALAAVYPAIVPRPKAGAGSFRPQRRDAGPAPRGPRAEGAPPFHRQLKFCCDLPDCRVCSEEAAGRIAEDRGISARLLDTPAGGKTTAHAFSTPSVARTMPLTHRIRQTCLDQILPRLSAKVDAARTASTFSYDAEAITAWHLLSTHSDFASSLDLRPFGPRGAAGQAAGSRQRRVATQLLYSLGTAFFPRDLSDVGDLSQLRRLAATKTFTVPGRRGLPTPARVQATVDRMLSFVFRERRARAAAKRRLFAPELALLRDLGRRFSFASADAYPAGSHMGARRFEGCFTGRVAAQLDRLCESLWLYGFCSSRYDVNLIFPNLAHFLSRQKPGLRLLKAGNTYKYLTAGHVHFCDVAALLPPKLTLAKAARLVGLAGPDYEKLFMPHGYYRCLERLYGTEIPPYDSPYFSGLNGSRSACSPEAYERLRQELASGVTHAELMQRYLARDVTITLMLAVKWRRTLREGFEIDFMDGEVQTTSSAFYRHCVEVLPSAGGGAPPFATVFADSTAYRILLDAASGGLCARLATLVQKGDPIHPGREGPGAPRVGSLAVLDATSLYGSRMAMGGAATGPYAIYNPVREEKEMLRLANTGSVYNSQGYLFAIVTAKLVASLGLEPRSTFSLAAGGGGECLVLPGVRYDVTAFCSRPEEGARPVLFLADYDGYVHFDRQPGAGAPRHHDRECRLYDPAAPLEEAPLYAESSLRSRRKDELVRRAYGDAYDVRIVRRNWCFFHNRLEIGGVAYASPRQAAAALRLSDPWLHVALPFPKRVNWRAFLGELAASRRDRRATAPVYHGFATVSGSLPPTSRHHCPRFGAVVARRTVTERELGPRFARELRERIASEEGLDVRHGEVERLAQKFLAELAKRPKLVASHSLDRQTVSLDYLGLLCSAGFRVTDCSHLMLFGVKTRASDAAHPFCVFMRGALARRKSVTGEMRLWEERAAALEALPRPLTREQAARLEATTEGLSNCTSLSLAIK